MESASDWIRIPHLAQVIHLRAAFLLDSRLLGFCVNDKNLGSLPADMLCDASLHRQDRLALRRSALSYIQEGGFPCSIS